MVKVAGYTPLGAGSVLFWINVTMRVSFWVFVINMIAVYALSAMAKALWGLYRMGCSFVALAQAAVGRAFPAALAGRALSADNLVVFVGVFVVQWGIGLAVDGFKVLGWREVQSFQMAVAVFLLGSVAAFGYFWRTKSHNQPH